MKMKLEIISEVFLFHFHKPTNWIYKQGYKIKYLLSLPPDVTASEKRAQLILDLKNSVAAKKPEANE